MKYIDCIDLITGWSKIQDEGSDGFLSCTACHFHYSNRKRTRDVFNHETQWHTNLYGQKNWQLNQFKNHSHLVMMWPYHSRGTKYIAWFCSLAATASGISVAHILNLMLQVEKTKQKNTNATVEETYLFDSSELLPRVDCGALHFQTYKKLCFFCFKLAINSYLLVNRTLQSFFGVLLRFRYILI